MAGCEALQEASHTATAAWSDARYLLVPLYPPTGQLLSIGYFASTSRHPAALTLTGAWVPGLRRKGMFGSAPPTLQTAHHFWLEMQLSTRTATPTLTAAGLLHLCHPPHTNAAHLPLSSHSPIPKSLFAFSSQSFARIATTKTFITTHSLKLHHRVSTSLARALFLSGPSHLRKQRRFPTFTTTQGPLARHCGVAPVRA